MPLLEAFVCKQYKMHFALERKLGHGEIFLYKDFPKAQETSKKCRLLHTPIRLFNMVRIISKRMPN